VGMGDAARQYGDSDCQCLVDIRAADLRHRRVEAISRFVNKAAADPPFVF